MDEVDLPDDKPSLSHNDATELIISHIALLSVYRELSLKNSEHSELTLAYFARQMKMVNKCLEKITQVKYPPPVPQKRYELSPAFVIPRILSLLILVSGFFLVFGGMTYYFWLRWQ